jgi:hypothetical protein
MNLYNDIDALVSFLYVYEVNSKEKLFKFSAALFVWGFRSSVLWLIKKIFTFDLLYKVRALQENYTFDVYVTKDERIKVLHFNPWGAFNYIAVAVWLGGIIAEY